MLEVKIHKTYFWGYERVYLVEPTDSKIKFWCYNLDTDYVDSNPKHTNEIKKCVIKIECADASITNMECKKITQPINNSPHTECVVIVTKIHTPYIFEFFDNILGNVIVELDENTPIKINDSVLLEGILAVHFEMSVDLIGGESFNMEAIKQSFIKNSTKSYEEDLLYIVEFKNGYVSFEESSEPTLFGEYNTNKLKQIFTKFNSITISFTPNIALEKILEEKIFFNTYAMEYNTGSIIPVKQFIDNYSLYEKLL